MRRAKKSAARLAGRGASALGALAGALLGGWFGQLIGLYDSPDEGAGFIMALLGAIVILGLYRAIVGRRTVTHVP